MQEEGCQHVGKEMPVFTSPPQVQKHTTPSTMMTDARVICPRVQVRVALVSTTPDDLHICRRLFFAGYIASLLPAVDSDKQPRMRIRLERL